MARMTPDDLLTAAGWLYVNEGDNGEADACHRVAAFLRAEAERRDREASVRAIAREKGVPAKVVRRALAQVEQ